MIDTDELYRAVGAKVRAVRENREPSLTQRRLADLLGIERTSVTNLEKGRQRVPLHVLYRLCDALSLKLEDVLPPLDEVVSEPDSSVTVGNSQAQVPDKTKRLIDSLGGQE